VVEWGVVVRAWLNLQGIPGCPLDCWDDGFPGDQVWVVCNSMGPIGVVRASSAEKAYEAAIDEILPDADENDPHIWEVPGDSTSGLAEGYLWRSSGIPSNPSLSSIYACEDLNGWGLTRIEDWNQHAGNEGMSRFVTVEFDDEEDEEE